VAAAGWLTSRGVVLIAVALAAHHDPNVDTFGAFFRWDGSWYTVIAEHGYPSVIPRLGGQATFSSIAFFPVFPALIRAVAWSTGMPHTWAALVVVNLAACGVAVLMWRLVRRLGDSAWATRSVIFLGFFPASFVLTIAYAEAVMLALSLGCMLALMHRHWLAAGVLGALAAVSRPNGVAIVACCAVAAVTAQRDGDRRALRAPALSGAGPLGWFAWLWRHTEVRTAWFVVERQGWHDRFDWGRATMVRAAHALDRPVVLDRLLPTLGLVAIAVGVLAMIRWRPPPMLWAWTAVVIALAVGSQDLGSRPRFVLTAFPLLMAVARSVRGPGFIVLLAASSIGLFALTAVSVGTLRTIP
jgi:hypothetical protein